MRAGDVACIITMGTVCILTMSDDGCSMYYNMTGTACIITMCDDGYSMHYSSFSIHTFQSVQLKASCSPAVAQPALPPAPTPNPSVHYNVCLVVSVPGGR